MGNGPLASPSGPRLRLPVPRGRSSDSTREVPPSLASPFGDGSALRGFGRGEAASWWEATCIAAARLGLVIKVSATAGLFSDLIRWRAIGSVVSGG